MELLLVEAAGYCNAADNSVPSRPIRHRRNPVINCQFMAAAYFCVISIVPVELLLQGMDIQKPWISPQFVSIAFGPPLEWNGTTLRVKNALPGVTKAASALLLVRLNMFLEPPSAQSSSLGIPGQSAISHQHGFVSLRWLLGGLSSCSSNRVVRCPQLAYL